MQVSFERSGGVIGAPIGLDLDSENLPPAQAAQLRQLIEAADFFNLPAALPTVSRPDRFQYRLTIQDGGRQHQITVGETAIPSSLRPLLDWLMEAVRSQ